MTDKNYEAVIGLEIHAELSTESKLFSDAFNRFGDEPNENITPVCTGQPGALPKLNKKAVEKAVLFGLAVNSEINLHSCFDRKSYFYPDSPRNFQITQLEEPIVKGGVVITEVDNEERSFELDRAHLEDDAGMLKHFPTFTGVDYNRAGVPLLEIVSKPCLHTPKEASSYAMEVRAILQYIGACDGNMEEGHLRIDANISVRKKGELGLRNKIEIKNMNSFSNLEKALEAEISRQIHAYEQHRHLPIDEVIEQATYRFDAEKGVTILMRKKEKADDYRYFPEPDLPPVVLTREFVENLKKQLPELPLERMNRYVKEFDLSKDQAFLVTADKKRADYFAEALNYSKNGKAIFNWMMVEFLGRLKERGESIETSKISPKQVGELISLIESGKITGRMAKEIADEMVLNPDRSPSQIVDSNEAYRPIADLSFLDPIVERVLKENAPSVQDYLSGREKAFAFLVGQVMKETKGKASPAVVNELLKKRINTV